MADLSGKQASQTVQIIGADSNGVEGTPVGSDSNGNILAVVNNASGASAVNIQDGGNSITVDATSLPLPTGAATSVNQTTLATLTGAVTEAAPATDIASSGLNGRLQRIAQRLTSIFTAQSDGTQQSKIRGATDGTLTGNYLDRLNTYPIPDKTGSGTLTALNATITASVDGCGAVSFQFTGTWVAIVSFEATIDNSNWFVVSAYNVVSNATSTTTAANGYFLINCGSWLKVRAKAVSYTSGTVTVVWNAGAAKQTSTQAEILSPLPGFVARANRVIAAGVTYSDFYTMTQNIALIDFHFGGKGTGQASLLRVNTAITEFVPGGGFNSTTDVTTTWSNAGLGTSAAIAWVYSTAQFTEGTGSASHTFIKSAAGDEPAIKYTWSTPKDVSAFRYLNADYRVTVAIGGNQTRTTQMILTDVNGATRTYQFVGATTTAPFSTEQWLSFNKELENPDASTGTFDPYNVSSLTLRLVDGGNKTGTIYWDNVRFTQSIALIERIYIDANRTFQLVLNPVELFNTGEVLALQYKNTSVASAEYTVTAKGVVR